MSKLITHLIIILFLFAIPVNKLLSQNNLDVRYASSSTVPDFLNLCGEAEDETVVISVDGFQAFSRTNIQATLHLFEGVLFEGFDAAASSAGITLSDDSDLSNPVFSLPDLSPSATISVQIAFSVKANCGFLDTLLINNSLAVYDLWEIHYDMGDQDGLVEFDATPEYRDAFAIPSFTLGVETDNGATRVGDCFSREIRVNNSALEGFVDELVYTNLQGAGISVEEVLVNGIPIPIDKNVSPEGDTLITAVIPGDYFIGNTIGNEPGDGDTFFDPDENIIITENLCVRDCYGGLANIHSVSWGCGGGACTEVSSIDVITIGEGEANVLIQEGGELSSENTGYCVAGRLTITISNDGVEIDDGFAAMMDVDVSLGLGSDVALSLNGYDITALRIAGIDLNTFTSLNALNGNEQFLSNPDGIGGLEDLDGDGYYDDLPAGASIEVTAFYQFDWTQAQDFDLQINCTNDFSASFNSKIFYTDQCDDRIVITKLGLYRPSNANAGIENYSDTDAFAESDIFYVTHTESRGIRFFEAACDGEEVFIVTVLVPDGIIPVIEQTQLIKNSSTSIPLLSHIQQSDTLVLTYDASTQTFLNGDYDIVLAFQADCTAEIGLSEFQTVFELYCPPCDCRHIWYCGNLLGPQIHATNPPCTNIDICGIGLQTTDFEVSRTTFGYTDNTYTTKIDPEQANKKVAISCDSVEMKVVNVVGGTPLTDSIGVQFSYSNVDGSLSTDPTFLFGEGELRIQHNGSEFTCEVDASMITESLIDIQKTLRFDLSSCLTENGLTLVQGDIVEFSGYFSISPDGPFPPQFRKVPNLRAFAFAIVDGQEYACDNFGDNFTIAKNNTVFDAPSSSDFPEGCDVALLNYRLVTVNNGFSDFFGSEYRQAVRIDSITFEFDPTILEAFNTSDVEVIIPGHPYHGNNSFSLPPLSDYPDGNYSLRFDTLVNVPALNIVQSNSFNLRIILTPNCKSEFGSSLGNNVYRMHPTMYFTDRYYAQFIGDGSCAEEKVESEENLVTYTEPPVLTFSPFGTANYLLLGDTAEWTLQHCNTSFESSAGLTWIAVEDTTSSIVIVSMEDISDPLNPVSLELNSYGPDERYVFAYAPGLVEVDNNNSLDDICNIIRIKAIAKRCGTIPFVTYSGWNCSAFREENWDPEQYPPCEDSQVALSLTTLEPFLDANVIQQPEGNPEICDTSTVAILVKNTGIGTAFDLKTQIILPGEGMELVPGSVEIAYPESAEFQSVLADPELMVENGVNIYEYQDFSLLNEFLDQNGLRGFIPGNPNNENQFILRYKFVTDCDFKNGSILKYSFQGVKGCGELSNYEAGESLPIIISGTEPDIGKLYDVSFSPQSAMAPGTSAQIEIGVTNLSSTVSEENEWISLNIPANISYVEGSSVALAPESWEPGEPQILSANGETQLQWMLPVGLIQSDIANITFQLLAPELECDVTDIDVLLQTIAVKELYCANLDINCDIVTVTSTLGDEMTFLPVLQNQLAIDFPSVISQCQEGSTEQIQIEAILSSPDFDFLAIPFEVKYFYDADGNGSVSAGDTEVGAFSESGPFSELNPLSLSHTLSVPVEQACGLILQIDTIGLPFLCQVLETPISIPQLQNAGADQVLCASSETTFELIMGEADCVVEGIYDYTWAAVPPALTGDLSNTKVPSPLLTISYDGVGQDTLIYILETERPECSISHDTVRVIRSPAVVIQQSPLLSVEEGESIVLQPVILSGTAPFIYQWAPEETLDDPASSSPLATPLEYTRYTVTITDASGCSESSIFDVYIGDIIDAQVIPSDTTICQGETVEIHASGGAEYLWLEGDSNPSEGNLSDYQIANPLFSNGLAGSTYEYTVLVTDEAFPGITDSAFVIIHVNELPIVDAGEDLIMCLGDTISILANASENNVSLSWSPDVLEGENTINPRIAPTETTEYILTAIDANGCVQSDTMVVEVLDCGCVPPVVNHIITNAASCGQEDGYASIGMAGNPFDYIFDWQPNIGYSEGAGNIRTSLPYGGYTVTITQDNDPQCFTTIYLTIENADGPQATTLLSAATCEAANGEALISPVNYSYTWSDGVVGFERTDLYAGTYFVTVTDLENAACPNVLRVEMPLDNPLAAEIVVNTHPVCMEGNGSVTINVTGGSGDYSFSWESGTNTQDNLEAGIYTVSITDNDTTACSIPFIFVLTDEVPQATVNILDVHHESCSGSEDGFVDFDLELDGNIALPLDTVISNDLLEFANGQLPPGDYCILITDANGCVAGGECFTVEAPDPLRIGIVSTPACDNEGTISLSLSGGVPPYTIDWQDLIGQDNAMERQGLIAASYSVTILDANGCVVTTEVEVEACPCIYPSIISTTIQPATCGNSDGAATIQLENDETAFEFFWEPDIGVSNIEGNSRTGLPFGAYSVTIVNANNELCSTEISFIITNSDGPQATGFTTPATCEAADGTASLQPEEFEYAWSDGGLGAIRQDLTAGTYYVTFFDPADPDCPNIMEIIVPQDNPLVAEMLVNVHPICGQSNGSVTVNVFGGSGDYSFSWPSATNTQDDLAAGIYTVTITDNSETGCSLPFIFVLTDDVPEAAVTITDTLHVSCYGAQDGGVLFDINFDPAFTEPADTIISNGIQQYENGELPPGGYCVMIVDGNGCVAGGACFTIESPDPIQFAFEVEPFCEEGGSVNVSISGGTAPFSYDWEDLEGDDNEQNRDSLPIGEFYLTVTDINECELSSGAIAIDSCAFCDLFTDVDSFYLQAPDCLSEATFCVPIPSDFIHRFVIEDNGAVYTKELGRCDYDTQGVYTYATLYGLGNAGPYEVISWPVNDEIFTGTFVAIQDLVDSMNVWDPMGNWSLSNDGPFILGGYNANNYDQIDVEVISLGITSFLGFNQGLYPNGYSVDLAVGSHELIITDTLTGCVENVWVEVICTNSDTLHLILDIGESDTLCLSGDELVGAVDTIYSGCEEGDNTTFEILNDSCVVFTGVSEGIDSVCLIACDSLGICDTTFLIIDVMDLIDNDIYDTITVSQTLEYCIDTSMVNLPGTIISIENICEDESGSFVYFEVDEETYCVQYSGLFIGTETACIEICDDAGNCDVINFHITVVPGEIVVDTIFINAPPETDCIDLSLLEGEAVEITDDCEDSNGENVIFTIDEENYCITYDGISVGTDTACIRVADAFGNISLTIYYITAVETTTEYILDTIYINETVIHCLDTTELPGTEPYFVDNFCWDESGDFVDFFTLPDSICLEYTGLEIGVDSACYIICDNLGICDTTFFTVWVVEYLELPIANNDTAYTIKETPVVVNIHGNDVIFGVDTTYISSGPSYGEASLNQDGSITYTPIGDFCDREDQLTYVICNSIGCDSAVVTIFIVCVDVEIFTAVSPNRDGVNDYFHIGGIEDKPENKLRIFNRWGNLVFETRAYQNDWDGTWNGKDLPDGTYYYMFEVNDNGEVFHFRGYLEIFR